MKGSGRQEHLLTRLLGPALEALPLSHKGPGWWLAEGDSRQLLRQLPPESADLVFADPPYNLSNGGTTVRSGERVAVDKGEWDRSGGLLEDYRFHSEWLHVCRYLLKPTATIWVSGTQHSIFQCGFAMQELGYHLLNTVTWFKPNAAPNLGCRQFTHSTGLVIWAAPAEYAPLRHTFHYDDLKAENGDKQMRDFWSIPPPGDAEKTHGKHPTQKPLALLERIIGPSTNPGDLVVDPFNGSGTTGVVAVKMGRRYLGIDLDEDYLDLTARRLGALAL